MLITLVGRSEDPHYKRTTNPDALRSLRGHASSACHVQGGHHGNDLLVERGGSRSVAELFPRA